MLNQKGTTILELMLVVVIIGILSMVSMTEYFKVHDRAYVGAAINDLQIFKTAISMHDAEWGIFPPNEANSMIALVNQLRNPDGLPYMDPPSGDNWRSFTYDPPAAGDLMGDYSLTVVCNDHSSTQITMHWNSAMEIIKLGD
ncbi:type II secretion system GspH family protein [bacterium]|nr:type II secretion system GspH family protein [bacterium]MBU1919775.1 type II secretion system GspH family protein [bacterium]